MKKGMLIILIVTIFTIGSSYRFIQLNKNISDLIKNMAYLEKNRFFM